MNHSCYGKPAVPLRAFPSILDWTATVVRESCFGKLLRTINIFFYLTLIRRLWNCVTKKGAPPHYLITLSLYVIRDFTYTAPEYIHVLGRAS